MGGRIYGGTGNIGHLFYHDTATGQSADLGQPAGGGYYGVYALTLGKDGLLYGGTGYYEGDAQFFAFNPNTGSTVTKRSAIPGETYVFALATAPNGDIWGGTGWDGHVFTYRPSTGSLSDKGTGMDGWSIDMLTAGPGGYIYGATSGGYLFRFNSVQGAPENAREAGAGAAVENLGQIPSAWGVSGLVPGPDGRIYGGTTYSDGHLFSYDPSSRQFSDLGMVQWEDEMVAGLVVDRNGVLYGGTGTRRPVFFSYNPANHPYRPSGQAISTDIVPALRDRGTFPGYGSIYALSKGADGRVFMGGSSGHLSMYNPANGQMQDLGQAVADEWTIYSLTTGPGGKIYGGTGYSAHLFVYDPAAGRFTDLGIPAAGENSVRRLTTSMDGKIYGGTEGPNSGTSGRLFVYDPATGQKQDLGQAVANEPYIEALTAGRDGKIYGGTGWRGHFFVYDPGSRRFTDLGQAVPGESYVDSLATAPDGTIWGGTWPNAHVFSYSPATGRISDRGMAGTGDGDIYALAVAADGQVYGGTSWPNGVLFRYDPTAQTFTRLGRAIPGDRYVYSLLAHDSGLIYGGTGYTFCRLFTYDPAFTFNWDTVIYNSTAPAGTGLSVDVLDMQNRVLVSGVSSGTRLSLNSRTYPALRLRGNFSTSNGNVTPRLSEWRVNWAKAGIALWPDCKLAQTNSVFTLDVRADGVSNLGRFQFTLAFNPSVLRVDGAVLGNFLGSTGRATTAQGPTINNTSGTVTFGATSSGAAVGPSGTGTLATITLRAKAAGNSNLTFSNVQLADVPGQAISPVATQAGSASVSNVIRSVFLPTNARRYSGPLVPVANGQFESGNLSAWQQGGELGRRVTSDVAHSGHYAALLGHPEAEPCSAPSGQAWIEQQVTVPSTPSPRLSLWYRFLTYDHNRDLVDAIDHLDILLNGQRVLRDANRSQTARCQGAPYDLGWKYWEYDLSAYRGQQVHLRLLLASTDAWWNSWVYVDDVGITP